MKRVSRHYQKLFVVLRHSGFPLFAIWLDTANHTNKPCSLRWTDRSHTANPRGTTRTRRTRAVKRNSRSLEVQYTDTVDGNGTSEDTETAGNHAAAAWEACTSALDLGGLALLALLGLAR